MTQVLLVGLGGFVGAIARFLFGSYVQSLTRTLGFPYGTLVVNLLGCLLIGFLFHLPALHRTLDSEARLLLITGFLGAFTTFSTFGNETLRLFQQEHTLSGLLYIGLSVGVGLGAVWLGQQLAGWLAR